MNEIETWRTIFINWKKTQRLIQNYFLKTIFKENIDKYRIMLEWHWTFKFTKKAHKSLMIICFIFLGFFWGTFEEEVLLDIYVELT
jgi:hypothetical protein